MPTIYLLKRMINTQSYVFTTRGTPREPDEPAGRFNRASQALPEYASGAHYCEAGITPRSAHMRRLILAIVLIAAPVLALGSTTASACGWYGYGYGGGCGCCAPRAYGYAYRPAYVYRSYFRPRIYRYAYYRPAYYYGSYYRPRFAYGGFYRPRVWGWRGWGGRRWRW
jgi:hypothetical protein